ncbi:restriction endonuclease subunit S [Phocaeicola plebeius]|uniref:restriction endonuclease subunit S n=1 Tax=Phocaeicola plebeius TaxID=310297 RepID=UPI0026ECBE50|nr:restriction endonuclease subunit S [Phocaeicola plebeius]
MENRYDKYKDSGIAWIGEIPEHWEVRRLKHLGKNYNGLTYSPNDICGSEDGILVLRSSNIKDNKLCFDDNVYVKKEIPQKLIVNKGDILICSRNGSAELIGKAAFIELQMVATFGAFMMIFKGTSNIYHKYLFYIVTSCISQYKWLFTTATINQLTSSMLGEIFAPFINNNLEQKSIATYLDKKCGEIDELITLQEEMITKLQSYKQSVITEAVTKGLDKNVPLKDSGIEWIGKIPEHWKVVKIKYLAKIKSGDSISSNEIIQEGIYEVYGGNGLMGYCNKKNVDGFNIIIGRVGALCGNVRLISESKYITDNALILNCFDNALYPYMYIMLKAANLNNLNTSNAQPLITGSKVLNVSLPIPPLSEQQSITDYLDQKCSEIDELISIKQQKIEKLKDYKKSLIFECVTGKRKV